MCVRFQQPHSRRGLLSGNAAKNSTYDRSSFGIENLRRTRSEEIGLAVGDGGQHVQEIDDIGDGAADIGPFPPHRKVGDLREMDEGAESEL